MLFDFSTQQWHPLSTDHVNNPSWSIDGKYIYYDTEGGKYVLNRVRVSDDRHDESRIGRGGDPRTRRQHLHASRATTFGGSE